VFFAPSAIVFLDGKFCDVSAKLPGASG